MKKINKNDIKKLLKQNGWMSEDKIAEQLKVPLLEVDKVLRELERVDLVESRNHQ